MTNYKPIYFSHDVNASNDPKIVRLKLGYGLAIEAIYWHIIEALHKESGTMDYELVFAIVSTDIMGEEIRTQLKQDYNAKDVIYFMLDIGLFELEDGFITNLRVVKNLKEQDEKHQKAKENGKKGANKRWGDSDPIATPEKTDSDPIAIKESKVNKSKKESTKEKDGTDVPTPSQQSRYFFSNNDHRKKYIQKLVETGYDEKVLIIEIEKFVSYWTERNKSGTKERWETEKTFEVTRRLSTWLRNSNQFSK
jgi:hypothetical protein